MENVIPIEDLAKFIESVVVQVNEGVALARSHDCLLAELPEQVQFEVTVFSKWQVLEIKGGRISQSNDTDTTKSTTTQSGSKKSESKSQSKGTSEGSDTNTSNDNSATLGTNENFVTKEQ